MAESFILQPIDRLKDARPYAITVYPRYRVRVSHSPAGYGEALKVGIRFE
ncbi:hypothetical protein [Paenibacillus sp. MMS18-CY102]|nr:hypothetical protein [Paenibacillus sp. MMS18-CY102]MWC30388.1 hypothetical protein [Paenibacillus sp. MMS18-CY102]